MRAAGEAAAQADRLLARVRGAYDVHGGSDDARHHAGLGDLVGLTAVVAVAVTLPLAQPERPDVGVVLVLLAFLLGLTALERVRPGLAPMLERLAPIGGAAGLAVLVWATGGTDSLYHVLFALVPVTAALRGRLSAVLVALAVTVGAAAAPLAYDEPSLSFATRLLLNSIWWTGLAGVVYLQTNWLRQRTAEATEASAFKTAILRSTSHELRTPLTIVSGTAELLERHGDQLSKQQVLHHVERIDVHARRLRQLLDDLLDADLLMLGLVTAHRRPTDLEKLMFGVLRSHPDAKERVQLRTEPLELSVDPPKIERAVSSLVRNALQHGPPDTPIELVLERVDDGARIVVVDHGPGVPDELKETIFAAFVQGPEKTEDPSPGTGIGLALASQFVHLHGGRLWVEDGHDGGARFLIHLPDDA